MGDEAKVIERLVAEASSNGITTQRLRELAGHPAVEVREAVARRRDLPNDVAMRLADSPDITVPWHITDQLRWPLSTFASDAVPPSVRYAIANRRALPDWAVEQLLWESRDIRVALAKNPDLPDWAALRLAEDPDQWVRGALAGRRDLAYDVRDKLSDDSDPEVRARLLNSGGA